LNIHAITIIIRDFQREIKTKGYEKTYSEAEYKTLVSFSKFLLDNGIDLTNLPNEKLSEISGIIYQMISNRHDENIVNRLVNDLRQKLTHLPKQIVEESKETITETIDEKTIEDIIKRRDELFSNKYTSVLEKLAQKIVLGKPKGTELAISRIISRLLGTTNIIDKILYCKTAVDLLPEAEKLIPHDLLEELRRYYAIAVVLKNSTRFYDGISERISMSLPFSQEEFKRYFEPMIKTRPHLLKYIPLTMYDEEEMKKHNESTYEIYRKIMYEGISFRSYVSLITALSYDAETVVNKIVNIILSNLRTVRYYLEKEFGYRV